MYRGTVDFIAEIKGNGLTFPHFDFDPHEPGVVKVEIEGLDGNVVRSSVHLSGVQSTEAGIILATEVNAKALNKLAFFENVAIENARLEREDFSSLEDREDARILVADPGRYSTAGEDLKLAIGRSSEHLKTILESPEARGERFYGLFRSARQSTGPVEEFMHLYQILMVLFNDYPSRVDAFIISKEPTVSLAQHPLKPAGTIETAYSRLRNEFAHNRKGSDLEQTKAEMTQRLGNLRTLTRQAIELVQNPQTR